MWFLLFIKQFPVIAIAEVKEIVPPPLRRKHPHEDHIDHAGRHLEYEPDTPGEYA
jgi:molybdopterin-containing oxidoreductase family membrane subunit